MNRFMTTITTATTATATTATTTTTVAMEPPVTMATEVSTILGAVFLRHHFAALSTAQAQQQERHLLHRFHHEDRLHHFRPGQ